MICTGLRGIRKRKEEERRGRKEEKEGEDSFVGSRSSAKKEKIPKQLFRRQRMCHEYKRKWPLPILLLLLLSASFADSIWYYNTFQLSEKSDVYSFGVVLLELITGKPPVQPGPDRTHLSHWVQQRLARGDIEDVVDAKLQGDYDVNSAWKVADVALRCVAPTSHLRPTMSEVVSHLKESLELVTALNRTETFVTSRESLCSETSSFTRENSLDAESPVGMTSSGTASARQVNLRTFV